MSPFWEPKESLTLKRGQDHWVESSSGGTTERPYLTKVVTRRQLIPLVFFVTVGLGFLLGRAFQLQIMQGTAQRALAEGNRLRLKTVVAPRGQFFDQYGRQLTDNVPELSLSLIPYDVPHDDATRERIFSEVSLTSGLPQTTLDDTWNGLSDSRKKSVEPAVIDPPLTNEAALRLELHQGTWPGVAVITTAKRQVTQTNEANTTLSHALGYVGRVSEKDLADDKNHQYSTTDVIGKTGLELQYETILKGTNGRQEVEVNALGQPQKVFSEVPPVPGKQVWLTIDADLQAVAAKSLVASAERAGVRRASLVALDPATGGVLALVSLPSFDVNQFNAGISADQYRALQDDVDHPLFNRVIQGQYPSGSTIKLVVAAAGLATGVISPATTVLSVGGIHVGPWFFPDWKAGGHGVTDVRKALADSVNTFFYMVGGGYGNVSGLGISRLAAWANKFGLGRSTGIDIPNEAKGLIPTPTWKEEVKHEQWYIGDTYHTAIGQGDVLVTPLQVAMYTNYFANGGKLIQPHFLSEVVNADGSAPTTYQPTIISQDLIPAEDLQVVREGLRRTITDGSARLLQTVAMPVAGKTGTAQVPSGQPEAWFTGFGPYDPTGAPADIEVTVMVENAGEGSSFAVPVAKDIFQWWAQNRLDH